MKRTFRLKYNKPLSERRLYGQGTERKYTTDDITRWVKYGQRLKLYKFDGTRESEEKIFQWIDYLLKSGNINI